MPQKYKFVVEKDIYEDYSGGRVLYAAPGATAFPVRLATELFQRTVARLKLQGNHPPYTVYDPFCGSGYLLTVLGFMHGEEIKTIFASDINQAMVALATKNLSLLSKKGLEARITELEYMKATYGKNSHEEALESAQRLEMKIAKTSRPVRTQCFVSNILKDVDPNLDNIKVDIVIADLPYGQLTHWQGHSDEENLTQIFLKNILSLLSPSSVVCICTDKEQTISHEDYKRLESLKLGKRRAFLLTPDPS